jgi:phage terminase large subunit GpA-like protein
MSQKEVNYNTLSFICNLTRTLRPTEQLSLSEWADRYMVLPEGSSESGKFSTSNIPYQKDILDAITDSSITDVTIMSSAQVGKTTILLCGIGYYIEHEPTTQLIVLPTLQLAERFSKTRLAKMIGDIPEIKKKIGPARTRDSSNTILFKEFPGGHVVLAGANSPASLSSMPLRIIWMDEVDRFPESAGEEGNPVKLAEARAKTFWNKKYIKTSTPTIMGKSKIEAEYKEGTMEQWCVKCPKCGVWQPYNFKKVNFSDLTMSCIGCEARVPEMEWKHSEHKWIAQQPDVKGHRSFHLNELASPYVEWKDIIDEFKKAYEKVEKFHDTQDLKTFINTALGECWDETMVDGNAIDEDTLMKRAEHYGAEIPDGVLLLTASVDVQDDRFEIEVRGWARDTETWGLYKTELYGNLEKKEVWERLEDYLNTTFRFDDGRELNIAGIGIDTGGNHTNQTYKWVRDMTNKGKRVYGLKGYAGKADIPLIHKTTKVDIKYKTKEGKEIVVDHTTIHIIGTDAGKDDITNHLKITDPGEGYCHFPKDNGRGYDKTYYEGLLSEHKITKKVNGYYKEVWVKNSTGIRNEPLDLFNYNYAVMTLLRPVWGYLEQNLTRGINYTKLKKKTSSGAGKRRKVVNGIR